MACEECSHTLTSSENTDDDGVSDFTKELVHYLEFDAEILDTKPPKTRREHKKTKEGQVIRLRSSKYVRCKRGYLKLMTRMPIDVLYEIFRHLYPLDLLYLSWASKGLRRVVIDQSARSIWEEVYEQVYKSYNPPPRCPEDTNLIHYTRFLYYKKCMICHTRSGSYTCWMMRLRVCYHCLVNSNQFTIPEEFDFDSHEEWYFAVRAKQDVFVFTGDVESKGDISWLSESEREKRGGLRKGAQRFNWWKIKCLYFNRRRKRAEREAFVYRKLEEIGWDKSTIKEINGGQLPTDLFGLDTQEKLTNKDWEDARPQIEEILIQMKQRHLDWLKEQRFLRHWTNFEVKFKEWDQTHTFDSSLKPHAADIAVLEPFNTIIFTSDIEEAEFRVDDIDRIAKEWVEWRENFLFSLLPQDLQDRYQANKLSLPSLAIFRFSHFSSTTLHNVTLKCIRVRREHLDPCVSPTPVNREIHEAFKRAKLTCICPWQWSNQDLQFDTKGFETANEVLKFLGLDPYTSNVTQVAERITQVEEHEEIYKCRTCREDKHPDNQDTKLYDWFQHYNVMHREKPTPFSATKRSRLKRVHAMLSRMD